MSELFIKIKIADREYPLRIRPDDEPMLQKAAKELGLALKSSSERTGIVDKQDLLAMEAFDLMVHRLRQQEESGQTQEQLAKLDQKISRILQEA